MKSLLEYDRKCDKLKQLCVPRPLNYYKQGMERWKAKFQRLVGHKVFHRNTLCDRLLCPSVCFHHNSRTIRRRMMKLCTYILEVECNIGFGFRRWVAYTAFDTVKLEVLHSIHVQRTYSCGTLVCICYSSLWNIPQECFMWSSCMPVSPSVRFHDNSWTIRRKMIKICTYTWGQE